MADHGIVVVSQAIRDAIESATPAGMRFLTPERDIQIGEDGPIIRSERNVDWDAFKRNMAEGETWDWRW